MTRGIDTSASRMRFALGLLAGAIVFVLFAWPGADERGIVAEEVQPYLDRHPVVLEKTPQALQRQEGALRSPPGAPSMHLGQGERLPAVVPMPPYEPGAPPRPRWVRTTQWPVVAYDGTSRMWPVFIRGHQTALGTYVPLALSPLFGDDIGGWRHGTTLLGLAVVLLTGVLAMRLAPRSSWLATLIVAASFGMISIARTAEAFEVSSRVAMMATLVVAAPRRPAGWKRAVLVGLLGGIAILCRATIAIALVPALAVLWMDEQRSPPWARIATAGALTVGVPVALVAVMQLGLPFRAGTAPLAGFPWAELPQRLLQAPRYLLLELGWLGDATSVFGPLLRGKTAIEQTLWLPAAAAAVPVAIAGLRLKRRTATDGEKLFVATLATSVLAGALLYGEPNQFQLALALEPFIALALASQVVGLARRWMIVAAVVVLAVRVQGAIRGVGLDDEVAVPMASARTQRGVLRWFQSHEVQGSEIVTTTYLHAGVLEGWTEGSYRPIHAWAALTLPQGRSSQYLDPAWREILRVYRPRYVLHTEAPNLFASGGMNPPAIEDSLRRVVGESALRMTHERTFATESGQRGWSILRLRYPRNTRSLPGLRTGAPRVLTKLYGLRRGEKIGEFVIDRLQRTGAKQGEVVLRRGQQTVRLEIAPASGPRKAPAHAGELAVFYHTPLTIPQRHAIALAQRVAARLDAASARP